MSDIPEADAPSGLDIAIIGMNGRFPGAGDLETFWHNLRDGVESITFFDDAELAAAGVAPETLRDAHYVKAGAVLDDVDMFDAAFFGFYPREAEIMDPQHRVFLECAWSAIEQAGYNPEAYPGLIGMYAGTGLNTYLLFNLLSNQEIRASVQDYQLTIGSDKDFLPTRVSYKLNLRGPSINIQTACSTSLVAVHLACQSLLSYQCDMALAGGVGIRLPQRRGYNYQEGGIIAPDGHCRAFDVDAQGTVSGNGVGVVVLKRLADALADGDTIHAVIKGSAINNDGAAKVGYTAPSIDGQADVIATAQAVAGVDPESISYIEAHGTGTVLGDPIEIAALTQVFRQATDATGVCAIGSVKTNIGHLDAAAGVAGLIKTVLALKHRQIPPSLHFRRPNPAIDFVNSPFYVNTTLADWPEGPTPRRAGVSSFGIGGTNAHVILEEFGAPEPADASRPWQLLLLSARTETALETATANLAAHLRAHPGLNLADVAHTLQAGRKTFSRRRILICRDTEDALAALEARDPRMLSAVQERLDRPVAFMFSGQGAQYLNMARELYEQEPLFRETVDQCCELLKPHLGLDLRDIIYPQEQRTKNKEQNGQEPKNGAANGTNGTTNGLAKPQNGSANGSGHGSQFSVLGSGNGSHFSALEPVLDIRNGGTNGPGHGSQFSVFGSGEGSQFSVLGSQFSVLEQTQYAQPALFVIEYALAQLWMAWGVRPQAMIGHSIGEYVAACLAGVFALEDALKLVAARGRLMQSLPHGAMLSVGLAEEQVRDLLGDQLSLAAVNAPGMCVVAGPAAAVDALERELAAREVKCQRLHTSHAFHSAMMDPILDQFTRLVERIALQAPEIPYLSNVSGTWITAEQATDPRYWARHLRQTVRFSDGMRVLFSDPHLALLELGPGQTLATLARRHQGQGGERAVLSSLRRPQDQQSDVAGLLGALGRLWLAGVSIDWAGFYAHERRQRVPLPTYPFERQRYWVEPGAPALVEQRVAASHKRAGIAGWLYAPSWKRTPSLPTPGMSSGSSWLVLGDGCGLGSRLAERLAQQNQPVIMAIAGTRFEQIGQHAYTIRPNEATDYEMLLAALRAGDRFPTTIVHLWNAGSHSQVRPGVQEEASGFFSLMLLAQALGRQNVTAPLRLGVVSTGVQEVSGDESLCPHRATLLGPCRVIPQEYPHITCQSIDLIAPETAAQAEKLVSKMLAELSTTTADATVAYRGSHRWVQGYEPVQAGEMAPRLREQGVYLITGGLGQIGLVCAEYLARAVQARLVLVGRSAFPERAEWDAWLSTHAPGDPTSRTIARLQAIEALGAEVLIARADVAQTDQMRAVLQQTHTRFGALHGVIHGAGIVGEASFRAIPETDRAAAATQFQPKVRGLEVLKELLHDQALDFCLLHSSLAAVLGGLGMAAYAAANVFMDHFAQQQSRTSAFPWISVNWDGWQFDQMSEHSLIMPTEGMAALERVLALEETAQVVVATGDLQARLERWVQHAPQAGQPAPSGTTAHARPDLPTSYVAPRDEHERAIAGLWEHVLGLAPIGIHDDFFELGGHSLLATQLAARLRDTFHVELPLRSLFESPTVAGLAALVRAAGPDATQASGAIQPISRDGDLPLSFGQRRLWFLDQLEPGSPLYNNPAAVRLTGRLDETAFRRSLEAIVQRHEVLRATFTTMDGRPVQTIAPIGTGVQLNAPTAPLQVMDLRDLPAGEREIAVRRLAAAEGQQPFDLARGPLLRVTLARLDDEEHVVLLTMHHIVSDGWSTGVLIRELAALYEAFAQGRPAPLPALPIQYADFAHWQEQWLRGEVLEQQLAYWRTRLGGALPVLELPTDHPRPPVQTYDGASHWFTLPAELAARLNSLSQQAGATLFMTLLAGFQTLLHRYSGQEDILVGSPIAGRTRAETEGLIGFFVNILVLRANLAGNPTFRELLGRVREEALGAYAHQDLPFEMLVDQLQPRRDMSRSPLFQVIFVLQNAPVQPLALPGLELAPLELDRSTEKYDLTLVIEEAPEGLKALLNYNTNLFEAATIARMAGHFQTLLEGIAADQDRHLSALPLLTEAEREQLLVEWNGPARMEDGRSRMAFQMPGESDPPSSILHPQICIHRLFEAQAARTPDAPALICPPDYSTGLGPHDAERLTYAGLNARANQLARHLRALGVGPETLVGVCVERSAASIVSLLAILKAGGAYLPLDPAYPADRLAFMLEDSRAKVLITTTDDRRPTTDDRRPESLHTLTRSPAHPLTAVVRGQWSVVDLAVDAANIDHESDANLEDGPAAGNAAYVIYTSGSTGVPKGVVIAHAEIAGHCRDIVRHYRLDTHDRVLQFASLNFDASLEQILPPLIAGAAVVLRGEDLWAPADFHTYVRDYGLTVINPPTAYWHQLAQEWANRPELIPEGLRLIIAGGDMMQQESVQLWRQTPLRSARLLNAYGPTETTITATTFDVPTGDSMGRRIPIGRALANRAAYILDRHGNLAPIGVPGELYIGGAGLARGYLNRPELTAERFVPNPFVENKEQRTKNKEQRTENQEPTTENQAQMAGIGSPAHPLTSSPAHGGRLYKTGDLARYQPDGTIEFLGRVDQQVKVRGFRIELGEIEAALARHPAVREAIVLARNPDGWKGEDGAGDRRLVAYLLPTTDDRRPTTDDRQAANEDRGLKIEDSSLGADAELSSILYPPSSTGSVVSGQWSMVGELRAFLKDKLPEYMIPAAFVALAEWPLTPGGKVDRGALPAPDRAQADQESYVAPRNPIEQQLADIWSELLGGTRVGAHDNFFELGGHSLLATRIVSRLRDTFLVDLALRRLFETPTVAGVAELIMEQQVEQADDDELNALLAELDELSDDEAQGLLADELGSAR